MTTKEMREEARYIMSNKPNYCTDHCRVESIGTKWVKFTSLYDGGRQSKITLEYFVKTGGRLFDENN